MDSAPDFDELSRQIRACRICRDAPLYGAPLPHEPVPIIRGSATARLCIASQAPGTKVHLSGKPFTDASGDRLRNWLGVTPDEFYDPRKFAIVPMGFCFPGQDARGADLPPRAPPVSSAGRRTARSSTPGRTSSPPRSMPS